MTKLKMNTKFLWINLFVISMIFNFPSKNDFNQKFIEVAKSGNPTVVSIISETIQE